MTEMVKNGESDEPEMQNNGGGEVHSVNENVEENPEPVERSQNDHLNKILLCSFLNKLNETSVEPSVEPLQPEEESNFED